MAELGSFGYPELAEDAVELITEAGAEWQLKRTSDGEYNPDTGEVPTVDTFYTIIGAKFDYESKDIDGTLIKAGDVRMYIAPDSPVVPQTTDIITINGEEWAVMASRPLAPATVVVLHDVQLRK